MKIFGPKVEPDILVVSAKSACWETFSIKIICEYSKFVRKSNGHLQFMKDHVPFQNGTVVILFTGKRTLL